MRGKRVVQQSLNCFLSKQFFIEHLLWLLSKKKTKGRQILLGKITKK